MAQVRLLKSVSQAVTLVTLQQEAPPEPAVMRDQAGYRSRPLCVCLKRSPLATSLAACRPRRRLARLVLQNLRYQTSTDSLQACLTSTKFRSNNP